MQVDYLAELGNSTRCSKRKYCQSVRSSNPPLFNGNTGADSVALTITAEPVRLELLTIATYVLANSNPLKLCINYIVCI
jgi:hypothetical protein